MLNGAALLTYTYFFFLSMSKEDAPVVVALFQMVPVFSVIWGAIFFNERFSLMVYIGIFLVLAGVTLISLQSSEGSLKYSIKVSSSLLLMIVSTLVASFSYALQKYLLSQTDFLTIYFWARVGDILCASFLFMAIRSLRVDFLSIIRMLFGKLL
jgi:drug/metabolite transporter (DMT)-like permease